MGAAELVDQVEAANQRADRAEQEADKLWAKLIELRVSERVAAEVVELCQETEAARDEAAGLRAELDVRRTWGLRRRLRWALGRRR